MVSAALREIFTAESHETATERMGTVLERLAGPVPKVAQLLEGAEEDLLAFYRSRLRTGPSCAAPTLWSGSTVRWAGAPTWLGSSPTTPR
jgi:hypothetical protein